MSNKFFIPLFAFFLFALAACGPGNTIRLLSPPPLAASSLPPPNAPSICVVNFEDSRLEPATIGKRRDGTSFITYNDVQGWISRALADELARKGFRVTFALTANQAKLANPDYLLTGIVNEVLLRENSATELNTQIKISCTLANRKGKLWTESCNSSQSRAGLPTKEAADTLLLDTLNELVKPVAEKVLKTAEK